MHAAPKLISAVDKIEFNVKSSEDKHTSTHLFLYFSLMANPFVCANYKRLHSPFCLDFLSSVKELMTWSQEADLCCGKASLCHCSSTWPPSMCLPSLGGNTGRCYEVGVWLQQGLTAVLQTREDSAVMERQTARDRAPVWWHFNSVSLETNDTWNKILLGCVAVGLQFPFCFTTINNSHIIHTK